jgi:hypothetical protein
MNFSQHLYELINSGITLTDKEAALVEDFLFSIQSPVSSYQLNSVKGRLAVGLPSSLQK